MDVLASSTVVVQFAVRRTRRFIRSTTQDIRVRATLVLDFGRIIARKPGSVLRAMIWRANEMQYVHVTRICETPYLGMEFWNWAR